MCGRPVPSSLRQWLPVAAERGAFAIAELGPAAVDGARVACAQAMQAGATVGMAPKAPPRAVFFDMDATTIVEESLVELARRVGCGPRVAAVTVRAMAGELDFAVALRERVALMAGVPLTTVMAVAASLTPMPGIKAFVAACTARGIPAYLVSGGFVQMAAGLAAQLGFAGLYANRFAASGGALTGQLDGPVVDADAKRAFVVATCADLAVPLADVAAVGDGANDLPMLNAVGVAIGHQPKPVLLPHLDAVNRSGDHAFLGPLLLGE